jgi:hypothetical protein
VTLHAAYVRFTLGDKEEVAWFVPGRMFVNGGENLLRFGRNPELLSALLPPDLDIKVGELFYLIYRYLRTTLPVCVVTVI